MVRDKRKVFFIRNSIILAILIYSLINLLKNDFDRYNVELEYIKYENKLEDINNEIQVLKDELMLSNTEEYIRVLVRERLGYISSNEKSVINSVKTN